MGASFRGHASGAPSKKSRVSSGSGVGGAPRGWAGPLAARAVSPPGYAGAGAWGCCPSPGGRRPVPWSGQKPHLRSSS